MYKLSSSKATSLYDDCDHFIAHFPPQEPQSPKSLLLSASARSLSSTSSANPSLISSIPTISGNSEFEQLRQAQECLATSASYMNEIESFFQELSTQCPTPIDNNWQSTAPSLGATLSLESLDSFNLDAFNFNTDTYSPDVIDPSIFNFTPAESDNEDEESHIDSSAFGVMNIRNPQSKPKRTTKSTKSIESFSQSPSSTTSSTRPKAPKFYSRSGQIADPSRGPCHNCHTTLTCYWRKLKGQYHCNACTLFFKRNKYHRSGESVTDKPIKRRNRKSKYSQE